MNAAPVDPPSVHSETGATDPAGVSASDSAAPVPPVPDLVPRGHDWRIAWALARRDLRARYLRSQLGAVLTLLQPILWLTTAVLAFWFLMGVGTDSLNTPSWVVYAVRTAAALAVWLPIAECWGRAPSAFAGQAPLIRRTRFPLLSIPLAVCLAACVTGGLSLAIAVLLAPWTVGMTAASFVWGLVGGTILTVLWAAAGSYLLAAVGVFFRDLNSVIGHFLALGMLITPVYYDPSLVPARWQWVLYFNPLAAPVMMLRQAFGGARPDEVATMPLQFVFSASLGLIALWAGLTLIARVRGKIPELL